MEKTALNFIAIAVFLMTLSFFITPIFNISPALPALMTFTVLGFFTIDTLSLNSRGTQLFLDIFTSSADRERIVIHEAGHFLIAYLLDIPISDYSLTVWDGFKKGHQGQGGVVCAEDATMSQPIINGQIPLKIERFCTVLMGGIMAEELNYGDIEGGKEDQQELQRLLTVCGIPSVRFPQTESWAKLQAKNLLQNHQFAFLALVEAMKNQASVEDCYEVIHNIKECKS